MATLVSQETAYRIEGEAVVRDFATEQEAIDWAGFCFDNVPGEIGSPEGSSTYRIVSFTKVVFS